MQLFSSFVGAITSRLWWAPGTGAKIEQVPLVLDLGGRLETDRVHLLHQLVVPVAVIAFVRFQHVELRFLFEMLGELRRIGAFDVVHRLRDVFVDM